MGTRQTAVVVLLLALAGGVALAWVSSLDTQERLAGRLLAAADALRIGDTATARGRYAQALALDEDDPRVAWLGGRIALRLGHQRDGVSALRGAWDTAMMDDWLPADVALIGSELADVLRTTGDATLAANVNAAAIGRTASLMRAQLDGWDVGDDGRPVGRTPTRGELGALTALALLRQAATIAVDLHDLALGRGDANGGERALLQAEHTITRALCDGASAAPCTPRAAAFRERAAAPIHQARTDRATAQALRFLEHSGLQAALALTSPRTAGAWSAPQARRRRQAAQIEYAVRLQAGASHEKRREWRAASQHYARAAVLWGDHGPLWPADPATGTAAPAAPPHLVPSQRTAAVLAAVDETSASLARFRAKLPGPPALRIRLPAALEP